MDMGHSHVDPWGLAVIFQSETLRILLAVVSNKLLKFLSQFHMNRVDRINIMMATGRVDNRGFAAISRKTGRNAVAEYFCH